MGRGQGWQCKNLYEDTYNAFGVGIKRWKICCSRVELARRDFSGTLDFKGFGSSAGATVSESEADPKTSLLILVDAPSRPLVLRPSLTPPA